LIVLGWEDIQKLDCWQYLGYDDKRDGTAIGTLARRIKEMGTATLRRQCRASNHPGLGGLKR